MKYIARIMLGVALFAGPVVSGEVRAEGPVLHPNAAVPGIDPLDHREGVRPL
jgi:hypothetical protein